MLFREGPRIGPVLVMRVQPLRSQMRRRRIFIEYKQLFVIVARRAEGFVSVIERVGPAWLRVEAKPAGNRLQLDGIELNGRVVLILNGDGPLRPLGLQR